MTAQKYSVAQDQQLESAADIYPKLYDFIKRRLGSEMNAQDALQQVFLSYISMSNRPTISSEEHPARFLFSLVRNVVERAQRRGRLAEREVPLDHMADAEDATASWEEELIAREDIFRSLQRMPAKQRRVFTLGRRYGYSNSEIAERLSMPQEAVKKYQVKALIQLRRDLFPSETKRPPKALKVYELTEQVAVQPNKIIVDVAPKIVVASAALAERLKREPQSVYNLQPRQFEQLVAELLEDLGYHVEVTQATRDGGRDLLAYLETELGTLLCLVEAKKYRRDRKVGIELVRALYGTMLHEQANQAMLVTTSSFTRDAREFRQEHHYQLALKDYTDLERWIRQYKTRAN